MGEDARSRRSFLKASGGVAILGGITTTKFTNTVKASPPDRIRSSAISPYPSATAHNNISGAIKHKGGFQNPVTKEWQHEFTASHVGGIVDRRGNEDPTLLKQWISVEEADGDISDIRADSNPDQNGLYPADGESRNWPDVFFTTAEFAASSLSDTVGNLLTVGKIIESLTTTSSTDRGTGFEIQNLYSGWDTTAEYCGASDFDIRLEEGDSNGEAVIECGGHSGLRGTANVQFKVSLWEDSFEDIDFPRTFTDNFSVEELRHPTELSELHPSEWKESEKRAMGVEKIPSNQVQSRFDELGIHSIPNETLSTTSEPVYYLHNAPVTLEEENTYRLHDNPES